MEKEFYLPKDFFDSCIGKLNNYKAAINKKFEQNVKDYEKTIRRLKNNEGIFHPPGSSAGWNDIYLEDYRTRTNKEQCEIWTKQFAAFSINDVDIRLDLKLPDLDKIEKGLNEAYFQITEAVPNPKAVKPLEATIRTLTDAAVTNKLTKPIIALICYYSNRPITRKNQLEIANEYGHEHAGRLYLDYTAITSKADRLATEHLTTITKQRNRKERYDMVISHLEGKPQQNAIDEFNTILARIENSNAL